jgi:hypothetical protein
MKKIKIQTNRLTGFVLVILACMMFSSSCKNEEYEYLPPEYLKISGVFSVTANSTRDYYTFYLDNADYVWTVPSGATITSGQGSSHIKVLFGTAGGTLSVSAKGMNASVEITVTK